MVENMAPLLEIKNLRKYFPLKSGFFRRTSGCVRAVDGISFSVERGETLGIVGESGCGKSTAGKTILRLIEPTGGTVELLGCDISQLSQRELRDQRRHMQIVFQDPYSSLNPKLTSGVIVGEPLVNYSVMNASERKERVTALFDRVGLRPEDMKKYPHEFSGGQRQRVGIARALALDPKIIIADEPVSALDVSVQAQVINLLVRLQDELGLTYIFIAHDLSVVRHISHRVAVMYLGRFVELAPTEALFKEPLHPYSQALLDAAPTPDPERRHKRKVIAGEVPSPITPPSGCHFHPRCPFTEERCRTEEPKFITQANGHWVGCHLHGDSSL